MHSAKEKLSNMASAAKEHIVICKAKAEEKAEKATARTQEGKQIAHENRKAKEARAKMELHEAKAEHAAEKLGAKQSHLLGHHNPRYNQPAVVGAGRHGHHQQPAGTAAPVAGTSVPTYPLGGHPPGHNNVV